MIAIDACFETVSIHHRIDRFTPLNPTLLRTEPRIRALCEDNDCGNWNRHPMCPPRVDLPGGAEAHLRSFGQGVLFQTTYEVNAQDRDATLETQRDHQHAALALEVAARRDLDPGAWVLVGGPCSLCAPCPALDGAGCDRPDDARPSLEALGIDVVSLQEAVGWDAAFHDDRVTWTGALLWDQRPAV